MGHQKNLHGSDIVDRGRLVSNLVAAYVANHRLAAADVPGLIVSIGAALAGLEGAERLTTGGARKATPAQIRASITHDALISFEDGRPYKSLKRHLTATELTPETYRTKWGLPADYPMVSPGYSQKRARISRDLQIGRYQRVSPPEPMAS